MMIINKLTNAIQISSNSRALNLLDEDWVQVPIELQFKAIQFSPFCKIIFSGEDIIDIIEDARPVPYKIPEPDPIDLSHLALKSELTTLQPKLELATLQEVKAGTEGNARSFSPSLIAQSMSEVNALDDLVAAVFGSSGTQKSMKEVLVEIMKVSSNDSLFDWIEDLSKSVSISMFSYVGTGTNTYGGTQTGTSPSRVFTAYGPRRIEPGGKPLAIWISTNNGNFMHAYIDTSLMSDSGSNQASKSIQNIPNSPFVVSESTVGTTKYNEMTTEANLQGTKWDNTGVSIAAAASTINASTTYTVMCIYEPFQIIELSSFKVVDAKGTAIPNCWVEGLSWRGSAGVYSNAQGLVKGVLRTSGTLLLDTKSTIYVDLVDQHIVNVSTHRGNELTPFTIVVPCKPEGTVLRLTSSRSVAFTSNVKNIDYCLVGGGGDGGEAIRPSMRHYNGDWSPSPYDFYYFYSYRDTQNTLQYATAPRQLSAASGGAGELTNKMAQTVVYHNSYPVVVAANNGATTFMGTTAKAGGKGASINQYQDIYSTVLPATETFNKTLAGGAEGSAGMGAGRSNNGITVGTVGNARTANAATSVFGDINYPEKFGGGGGFASYSLNEAVGGFNGGAPNGGPGYEVRAYTSGGYGYFYGSGNRKAGIGGGGGSGTWAMRTYSNSVADILGGAGLGGDGIAFIRLHF